MNLKYYKGKLRAIDREMETVKRHSTIEIDEAAKRLRELRIDWANRYTAPTLNKLALDRVQIQRLIAMERERLNAKKPTYSRDIWRWGESYCRTHEGRFRIRAVGNKEEWVILTKLPSHGRPTEHYGLWVLHPNRPLFTQQGRLTKAVLEQMIRSIEMSQPPAKREDIGSTPVGDPGMHPTTQTVPQTP